VPTFTIQQMAIKTGLSADTLRYYEKLGLLAPSRDAGSNHRRYSNEDVAWLGFVLLLRSTGMPLETIKAYGELLLQGNPTLAQRREMLEAHAKNVKRRMDELQVSLEVIQKKMKDYIRLEEKKENDENGTSYQPSDNSPQPKPAKKRREK
jgi:DNA-binding transcriptional MerR regulator